MPIIQNIQQVAGYLESPGELVMVGRPGAGQKVVTIFGYLFVEGALSQAQIEDEDGNQLSTNPIVGEVENGDPVWRRVWIDHNVLAANKGLGLRVITGAARAWLLHAVV